MMRNLSDYQERIETVLAAHLPTADQPPISLHEAMRYAVLNGGKRIRPLLVYAAGDLFNVSLPALDRAAMAVELIHCYSLVHDDLPAMDNDDLRRGLPTCHKVYGEGMAMLAGDALQAEAFSLLANPTDLPAERQLNLLALLANACGSLGMAGGQAIDLSAVGRVLAVGELEQMHRLKTGALIKASVLMGASTADLSVRDKSIMSDFADYLGLAFQIQDDILDVQGETALLGKQQGADLARGKPTYPSTVGMVEAKKLADIAYNHALALLQQYDEKADFLRQVTQYIVQRQY